MKSDYLWTYSSLPRREYQTSCNKRTESSCSCDPQLKPKQDGVNKRRDHIESEKERQNRKIFLFEQFYLPFSVLLYTLDDSIKDF